MSVCSAVGRRSVFHSISSACLFFFFFNKHVVDNRADREVTRDFGGRTGHQRNWKLPSPPPRGNVPLNSRPFSGETSGKRSHVCSYARLNRWLSTARTDRAEEGTHKSNWFYIGNYTWIRLPDLIFSRLSEVVLVRRKGKHDRSKDDWKPNTLTLIIETVICSIEF